MRSLIRLSLILTLFIVALPSLSAQEDLTIAELVATNEDFSILLEAATVANLAESLGDPEAEWTVFAPTNDAFAALPAGALEGIMSSPPSVEAVLQYHLVEGILSAEDIAAQESLTTVLGAPLTVTVGEDGVIFLNETIQIVGEAIPAANGVIYMIDGVFLPARPGAASGAAEPAEVETLVSVIASREDLAFLNTALTLAPVLAEALAVPKIDGMPYTVVLAPTDEAFSTLDETIRNRAITEPALLGSILLYHIGTAEELALPEDVIAAFESQDLPTIQDDILFSSLYPNNVEISLNEAGVAVFDGLATAQEFIPTSNGVIVVVDKVLVPPQEAILTPQAYEELLVQVEAYLAQFSSEAGSDAATTSAFPEGPALDANWGAVAGGFEMAELDTADDFFVTVIDPFAEGEEAELYGIEIINWTAEYQYTGFIVKDYLPAEVLLWMAEQDPTVWENISPAVLKLLPAEELALLPEEVQAQAE